MLYQYPMQSQPMVIPDTGIGQKMMPVNWNLSDPVLLRHILCLMIVAHNIFHIYLCWRQLNVCHLNKEPPRHLQSVMSMEVYLAAKAEEMFDVEQLLLSYVFDTILCCIELYFCVYPWLWKMIINTYSIVDDLIWQSIAFVALFSFYMVMRQLPQILYNKLVLEYMYDLQREKSLPLVGVLCMFSLLIVLLQVLLIPLTVIVLFIVEKGGEFFVIWIWIFFFVLSVIGIIIFNRFGIPFFGKITKLPEAELSSHLKDVLEQFNFPLDCVYIIHSFVSQSQKAIAAGLCCCKRVYILEHLLLNQGKPVEELFTDDVGKGLNTDELAAYIAHELAHWRKWHRWITFCIFHLTFLIYLLIFGVCYRQSVLYEAAGFSPTFYPPIVGNWLVYKFVMKLYLTITTWLIFYFTRRFEYSADKYTIEFYYSEDFKAALLKLIEDNPTFPFKDNWYQMWHCMRPTYFQRIKNMLHLQRRSQRYTVVSRFTKRQSVIEN